MRPLIFEGPVHCLAQPRDADWRLRGRLRSEGTDKPAVAAELLLSGVRSAAPALPLPPRLHELRVHPITDVPEAPRAFRLKLEAREGGFMLEVEALRVHHDVARPFYAALPRIRLPRLTRIGWAALLTLLRVPLISRRLLKRTAD